MWPHGLPGNRPSGQLHLQPVTRVFIKQPEDNYDTTDDTNCAPPSQTCPGHKPATILDGLKDSQTPDSTTVIDPDSTQTQDTERRGRGRRRHACHDSRRRGCKPWTPLNGKKTVPPDIFHLHGTVFFTSATFSETPVSYLSNKNKQRCQHQETDSATDHRRIK